MIGRETLDDPRAPPAAVRRTLGDIARLNALFGGTRAVMDALAPFFQRACNVRRGTCDAPWTLLDVGAGSGDIARAAAAAARGHGLTLRPVAVELSRPAAREAQGRGLAGWMASFDRIARRAVVLADLRRSRVAMVGVWLASLPLGMAATTRHDAVVSLRRGYTLKEFRAMLREAGVPAVPRYRPGFRIVAAWSPGGSQ